MIDDFNVEEEEEKFNAPMTIESLRERLKHIACLCWGLSIDLSNDLELSGLYENENRQLRKRVATFDKNVAKSEKRLLNMSAEKRRETEINRLRKLKYRQVAEERRRESNKNA